MSLCPDCRKLSISELRDRDVVLKENLAELVDSAEKGCPFCLMCWSQFQQICDAEDIKRSLEVTCNRSEQSADRTIYVRSRFNELEKYDDRMFVNITQFSTSAIWIFSGEIIADVENLFWKAKLHAELTIFAEPETLAARYLRGRNFTSASNSDHYISWVKTCLSECQDHHDGCCSFMDWEMPTRVIDLGPPGLGNTPYILETCGRVGKYMALSYCWGDGVRHQVKLKKSTYTLMLGGFEEQWLTKTHREALQLAREVGYQYVWIDALCIVQDDVLDWEKESSRMADCYENASLTLIAGRSGSSLNGFVENQFIPTISPIRFKYTHPSAPDEISDWYVCLPRSVETGPVEDRAWCFQEHILSRRSLIFGIEAIFVACQERMYGETGFITNLQIANGANHHLTDFALMFGNSATGKEEMMRRWYGMVSQYSNCSLFEPHDVFAALMGLTKEVEKTLRCRYLAGLWEDDMIRGLLWQGQADYVAGAGFRALQRPTERNPKKPQVLGMPAIRAPSWSWASVEGPIVSSTSHRQEHDKQMFEAGENLCVRPAHRHPTRWTSQMDSGVDKASMPMCELELFGAPKQVLRSNRPLTEEVKKDTSWRFAGARAAKFAALSSSQLPDHLVGMGLFDVEDEQTDSLWCMRIIRDRGLMLRLDQEGKFHRLGKFFVLDEAWFQSEPDRRVSLV